MLGTTQLMFKSINVSGPRWPMLGMTQIMFKTFNVSGPRWPMRGMTQIMFRRYTCLAEVADAGHDAAHVQVVQRVRAEVADAVHDADHFQVVQRVWHRWPLLGMTHIIFKISNVSKPRWPTLGLTLRQCRAADDVNVQFAASAAWWGDGTA